MCKQKAVLETIKQMKGRGSMSASQIKLAEAQCDDYQEMKKEMNSIPLKKFLLTMWLSEHFPMIILVVILFSVFLFPKEMLYTRIA